jgi:chemotaxis protein methyltransferase CheR
MDAEITSLEPRETDDAGLNRLLESIYSRYHYDFRSYSRSTLHRRIDIARRSLGDPSYADLADRVALEPAAFAALLAYLTVQVSDLFRDPSYYRAIRHEVVPHLATYPYPRLWVAGCGAGEEAYSIAIVLHEEGLLERSLIYATDIDPESLRIAGTGTYALERVRGFSRNYFEAAGRDSLSSYYTAAYSHATFSPLLRKHVLFSDHSLATDAAFAEVQLVSCRNVLIYFDDELQERAIGVFRDALCPRGFLGLGARETLSFSRHEAAFEPFAADERLYRLK